MVTSTSTPRPLPDGIYVPTVTFFKPTAAQELDLDTYRQHITWMGSSGIKGVVVQGSTGEAVALSREERNAVTSATRQALDSISRQDAIVVVGTVGAQSTAQAIEYAQDGHANGAEYALVLPPSYYATALSNDSLIEFFTDVADASPIPILIYSYPGVSSGIDMSTDLIQVLANHPNIAGIKHTDHNLGKIARLSNLRSEFTSSFSVLGGASDYLLSALAVGAQGCITGMGNVTPRLVVEAYDLYKSGKHEKALTLAGEISKGEWALGKGGITGTKYASAFWNGLPPTAARCRKPLPEASATIKNSIETELKSCIELERRLEQEAGYKRESNGFKQ